MSRAVFLCVGLLVAASPDVFAQQAPPVEAPPKPAEILARAEEALRNAGNIKASIELEVWYPAHYTSAIELYAAPSGDERAQIKTRIREDSFQTLEVISGGILWTQSDSPVGILVTMVDINKAKKELASEERTLAAGTVLGTNAIFDVAGLAGLVDFVETQSVEIGGKKAWAVSGALAARFADGKQALPPGARRWYESATVCVGEDYLPLRIELGKRDAGPLLRLDFKSIEANAALPEGVFTYKVPDGVDVVDRTDWAISEIRGDQARNP